MQKIHLQHSQVHVINGHVDQMHFNLEDLRIAKNKLVNVTSNGVTCNFYACKTFVSNGVTSNFLQVKFLQVILLQVFALRVMIQETDSQVA